MRDTVQLTVKGPGHTCATTIRTDTVKRSCAVGWASTSPHDAARGTSNRPYIVEGLGYGIKRDDVRATRDQALLVGNR